MNLTLQSDLIINQELVSYITELKVVAGGMYKDPTKLGFRNYKNELYPPSSGTLGLNTADTIKYGQCMKQIL